MERLKYDIVLLGAQGSGKGTQGRILSEKYNAPFFEMGAYLRKIIDENTFGDKYTQHISEFIKTGSLVPDEEINDIIKSFILQHQKEKIIFDGVCRTLVQKEYFSKLMKSLERKFIVIYISLKEDQATDRLIGRRICKKCKTTYPSNYIKDRCSYIFESGVECGGELVKRQDDASEESIKKRLGTFFGKTMESIFSFRKDGNILEIDGSLPIDKVSFMINNELKNFYEQDSRS